MSAPRILIGLAAAAFGAFGLLFLVSPALLGDFAAVGLAEAAARAEIRAMYGGLEIGLAVFLVWCARAQTRFEAGLMASALGFLGLASGRIAGMALEGAWTTPLIAALAVEIVAGTLACWGLSGLRRRE